MKKKLALLLAVVMLVGMIPVPGFAAEEAPVWDLLDCTMDNWEANWNKTVKAGQIQAEVTQENGYVNINKGDDKTNNPGAGVSAYTWLVPKTAPALPSGGKFTLEVTARSAGPVTSEKHGEISVRMGTGSNDQNGKLYPMFLKHGVEDGYIATQAKGENGYTLNTTVWHNYGLVVDVDTKTMDLYVDGELVIPGASALTYKGGNLLRIGVDNNARCNMDILAARMGTGDLSAELSAYEAPAGETPAITAVTLSGDSQVELTETQVEVTVDTVFIADGETVTAQLVNAQHEAVEGVAASGTVTGNQAKITLTIPATVAMGEYAVKASWQEKTAYSGSYTVKSALKAPVFPTFAAEGFTIEMPDYGYNPTDEFNFPTIVDTRDHPVSNELGDYRYYLFYAPHDAPAGNCVAASNSLDGPWVEYEGNPVVARSWEGNYSVSHVSSPFVMWLEEQNCYIMYFHGENPVTRYATSTDLLHWTYGGECVNAKDFREDGGEASYARVFRHEVPGLGNKYIMLLMISPTGGFSDKNRDICWAHSANGTDWTVVKEPLLDPTWNDVYQGNFSGPFFMPWEVDGEMRYFVICHASTGEMYTFEVGEKLDQYIEWGEFYNSIGIRNVDDLNPDCYPDYGRSGAPYFIQDDNGRWHMFYEAGKRLNTNIVHAVEVRSGEEDRLARAGLEVDNSALQPALTGKLALRVFDKSNRAVDLAGLTVTYHVSDETVISCDSGVIAALDEGTATVWAEVTRGEETILSEKVEITVTVPGKEIMVSNAQTPNKTALNLELPAPFKAADFLTNPIDNYYLYFSYNDESGGTRSIALATAPAPEGPWTVYNEGTPVMTKESLGVSGEVNAPWPIWDGANNRMLMYYSIGANTICVAESTDGVNFTNIGVVLTQDRLDNSSNAYQQSVYEYTIPGKNNKYLMLFTGNGYASGNVKNGKRLFYAWSDDGLNWTVEQEPLHSPSAPDSGDKGNVASPRLQILDGVTYLIYHNSGGNIGRAKLDENFRVAGTSRYYAALAGEPDRGRAADAAILYENGTMYMYYTARSNKAKTEADASLIVCRNLGEAADPFSPANGELLFFDDFETEDSYDNWAVDNGSWTVGNGVYTQNNTTGGPQTFAGDMSWTDYTLEVEVTPVETGKNVSIMLNGRATDVKNRYIGSYNNGKLTINRRINGSDKVLTEMPYTMELGQTYTMKMAFFGEKIYLYINGELLLEAADSTYASGKIGLVTYMTKAEFDNVTVRRLTEEPVLPQSIAINEFGDHQVIQRNPETENAQVTITGTVNKPVEGGSVEVRVVTYDGGETVADWVSAGDATAETFSADLTLPQGGWYRAEARIVKDDAVVYTAETSRKFGVGINILCIGQSNMVGQAPERPCTVADDLVANYTRSGNWTHLVDPYDGAGGSMTPALGNYLVEKLGIPVGFVPAADSGSGLHAPNPYTNPPHGPTRYWLYRNEDNHGDTSTIYGKAVTRAKAAGGVELMVWNQGETDGAICVSTEVYMEDMNTLLSRFRSDLGNETLPIFMCQIGTHDTNISNDEAYSWIRTAIDKLDDGKNFFMAATEMEFDRKDTAHYKKDGMDEIGRRVANTILYSYGMSEYYRGPAIVAVDYADDTRSVVDVTIQHRGGTDIAPETGITGFTVRDNADVVQILSAQRLDATHIRLTLAAPIAGSGSMGYLYGLNPEHSNIVKDNTEMKLPLECSYGLMTIGDDEPYVPSEPDPDEKVWDILDHDFYPQWDSEGFRASSKVGTITQGEDFVHISKDESIGVGSAGLYNWVCSPAGVTLPRDGFTLRSTIRITGPVEAEANEFGIRMGLNSNDLNGKLASVFLGYGEKGFISASVNGTGAYTMELDTTVWHTITIVVYPMGDGYSYDVYVDDTLAFDNVPMRTYKGGDLVRFGADNEGRCNMDVQDVHVGGGEILPEGVSPARLTGITLDKESQKESESNVVTATVTGREFEDGAAVKLTLLDKYYNVIPGVTAEGTFESNKAEASLTIPAGLNPNNYIVMAEANGRKVYATGYQIVPDREAPVFPSFTAEGYTIELEDYLYNPTQEFNFPNVVDTKDHPVSNELGDYRYYLFYAPHDAPAGCCVAVSNSLDGPWVEYGSNPVVARTWEKEDGSGNYYSASHVSSPYVMWNDVYNCWFMYFHGENNITRYATSDDLLHWTYGDICVRANDFSSTGSGLGEASYARVFEHQVPGLDNKYVMFLMITGGATGGHRNIYWAHSKDGKEWTAVTTSLLDPTMDETYKGNFSGPFFLEWEGRYFVICHASSGNMYAFEVGESLDILIPWGVFYDSIDSADPNDPDHDGAFPDYGRAGAPCFIQDDDGVWHMFYEGGKRLHANIVHATGVLPHTHELVYVEAVDATCVTEGVAAHWHCEGCGKNFADAEGTQELESVTTPVNPENHTGNTEIRNERPATATEDGYTGDVYCKDCGALLEEGEVIPATGETEPTDPEPTDPEPTDPEETEPETTQPDPTKPTDPNAPPQTGHNTPVMLWTLMMAASLMGIALVLVNSAKKRYFND